MTPMSRLKQPEFAVGSKALHLAKQMTGERMVPRCRMRDDSIALRAGLHAKATQTYGAVMVMIDQGLFGPCSALARVLFETAITQEFLCRRSVRLPAARKFGSKLTQDIRSDLYFAYCCINDRKAFEQRGPSGMRKLWKEAMSHYDNQIAHFRNALGRDWMDQLKTSKTCTGLDVGSLATCLGKEYRKAYDRAWRFDSKQVHATDAVHYIEPIKGGGIRLKWYDFETAFEKHFYTCTVVFIESLTRFMRAFEITEEHRRELMELHGDFTAVLEE